MVAFLNRRHCRPQLLLLIAAIVCLGCGASGLGRIPLQGSVTRGGKPVELGAISLVPAKGHKGLAGNASIAKGKYKFTVENGPTSGLHDVMIQEFLPKEELMRRQKSGTSPPTQFQQQFEVPATGKLVKDFQIE